LKEQDLLNPLEVEDYKNKLRHIDTIEMFIKQKVDRVGWEILDTPDEELEGTSTLWYKQDLIRDLEELDKAEDYLFQYNRRLIEGLKTNPIPDIDKSKFKIDAQYQMKTQQIRTLMGETESKQVETQASKFANGNTKIDLGIMSLELDKRKSSMNDYFNGDIADLVRDINSEKYINKLTRGQRHDVKNIDSLMDESPGLVEDTILYRGGHWDIHLKPGDHSKFRAYTSTSFQKSIADSFVGNHHGAMNFIIHAPKGTKGISGNDRVNFRNGFAEHEYVLPRNMGYTVLSIDYETMTAEILLDTE
jgi:hypothetical protein